MSGDIRDEVLKLMQQKDSIEGEIQELTSILTKVIGYFVNYDGGYIIYISNINHSFVEWCWNERPFG